MGVVLLEAAHASQSAQRARQLVAMQHAKVSVSERELSPRAGSRGEHQTVAGTVHGLEGVFLLLHLELEHVLGVVLPVARGHPQLGVVDVGRDDLDEAAASVLGAHHVNELVVDDGALRVEEATARTQLVKEEQLLLLIDLE